MEEVYAIVKQNKSNKLKFASIPKDSSIVEGDRVVITKKDSEKDFIEKILVQLSIDGYIQKNLTEEELDELTTKIKQKQ